MTISKNFLNDQVEIARRFCPLIFLIDTSGSMRGAPIGAVHSAIQNILLDLASMNASNSDAEIGVAILTFSTGVKWITGNQFVNPESFAIDVLRTAGVTSMGKAFKELNKALSEKEGGLLQRVSGSVSPILCLLSDGAPTDNYKEALKILKENYWYKMALKAAIGYGEYNKGVLKEFTTFDETVMHADNPTELKTMIEDFAVKASSVTSRVGSSFKVSTSVVGNKKNTYASIHNEQEEDELSNYDATQAYIDDIKATNSDLENLGDFDSVSSDEDELIHSTEEEQFDYRRESDSIFSSYLDSSNADSAW